MQYHFYDYVDHFSWFFLRLYELWDILNHKWRTYVNNKKETY